MIPDFHYSDVLSVSDGRLLSNRHMDGVSEVLGAMTEPGVTTIACADLATPAKAFLRKLYPFLASDEVRDAISAAVEAFRLSGDLAAEMEKHVRPLMPAERLPVPRMTDADVIAGYGEYLKGVFADKDVIVVHTN